jgi:hypothetical protein
MSDPGTGTDYLAGRFFVGLFAAGAAAMAVWIAWEMQTGVSRHRNGNSARAVDPSGFWTDIAVQGALMLFFAWQSYRLRRFAKR